ncbi:hypothetical protein [Noviherbaspirillum denitrificans]|uniref:Carboxypeptidase regulatory-like domain-containing protein n=1 Tax=Noviherbaspirillum denitrificans TaxID=1968433 RepID=A0A254TEE0_9BURK|nr:hypothetical protein [Noviherbaspirillum denitrificans]OWW21011.1 hypothetical protein AYR66_17555 [Noviherbaspirillum denitrificans]
MKTISSLLAALGLVALPALAQVHSAPQPTPGTESSGASVTPESAAGTSSSSAKPAPAPSPTDRLKPATQDNTTYMCGGVGEEESTFMKQRAKDYDLMLTFATRSGAYLADVDVDIRDAAGNTVLQIACDSPILLVDLPKGGTYKVRAETAGYALNKTVRVAGGRQHAQHVASSILSWPQQVAEMGGAPTTTGSGARGQGAAGNGAR